MMRLLKIDGCWIVIDLISDNIQVGIDIVIHGNIRRHNHFIRIAQKNDLELHELWKHPSHDKIRDCVGIFKVVASQNLEHNLPTIKFSNEVIAEGGKKLGIVDVEKLALIEYPIDQFEDEFDYRFRYGFKNGYNQCLSDNADKKFTKEHLANYLTFIEDNYQYHSDTWHDGDTDEPIKRITMLNKFIQSLTKEEYFCELEMEIKLGYASGTGEVRPKITNNSVTITKIWK